MSFVCVLHVGFPEEVFYEVVVVGAYSVEPYLLVFGVDAVVGFCRARCGIAEGYVDEVVAVAGSHEG